MHEESAVGLFLPLSVRLSVCPSVHLSVCLSVCLSICLSVYLPSNKVMSVCLSVCLSVCMYVCLSVCLPSNKVMSVCLSVCMSVCLPSSKGLKGSIIAKLDNNIENQCISTRWRPKGLPKRLFFQLFYWTRVHMPLSLGQSNLDLHMEVPIEVTGGETTAKRMTYKISYLSG